MMGNFGKLFVSVGCIFIVIGLSMWFLSDKLSWFGNLPGDVKIEQPRFHFYAPITTMIIISILLSLVFWLIARFFR